MGNDAEVGDRIPVILFKLEQARFSTHLAVQQFFANAQIRIANFES